MTEIKNLDIQQKNVVVVGTDGTLPSNLVTPLCQLVLALISLAIGWPGRKYYYRRF